MVLHLYSHVCHFDSQPRSFLLHKRPDLNFQLSNIWHGSHNPTELRKQCETQRLIYPYYVLKMGLET